MKNSKPWRGWYFAPADNLLANDDGREIFVGETHSITGHPVLCQKGLHASKFVFDALQYATSHNLYRVELYGIRIDSKDKSVATTRHYLYNINAEKILRKFACDCALSISHLWDCPDVVKEYLLTQ